VQLDIVQLHGEEPIEFARWVGIPVTKAFVRVEAKEGRRGDQVTIILFWLILSLIKVRAMGKARG
jgi:phosphoribosylanthranilate isomerase